MLYELSSLGEEQAIGKMQMASIKQKRRFDVADKRLRNANIDRPEEGKVRFWLSVGAILLLGLVVNTAGINWGRCGYVPWQPDSIEGWQTVCNMPLLFNTWTHKYPRGQYLLNAAFYKPLIEKWKKKPVEVTTPDGKRGYSWMTTDRLYVLAGISRWITVVMSLSGVLAVILTCRELFRDNLSSLLSGLMLSTSWLWALYSSSGCVDIPATAWFAWACFLAVKAVHTNKWGNYILLGFCLSYAVCTKEGVGTFIIGLGIAMWGLMVEKALRQGEKFSKALKTVFSLKILTTICIAMITFLIMQGFLAGPKEFLGRIAFWKNVVAEEFVPAFKGQLPLLWNSCKGLYTGLGWPFITVAICGMFYWAKRYRWKLLLVLGPLLTFYFLTVMRIYFNAPRFMLCGYIGIAILIGKTLGDWVRWQKIPSMVRYISVVIVYGLSLMACVGLNLELRNDTRDQVVKWFKENVKANELVASPISKVYTPHLQYNGYRQIHGWSDQGVRTPQGLQKIFPRYLVTSPDWPCKPTTLSAEYRKKLFAGETEYKLVAAFNWKYFHPQKSLWAVSIWPMKKHTLMSPGMQIYEKKP